MTADFSQLQTGQRDPDRITRIGGWLFEHRTLVPLAFAVPLLIIPATGPPAAGLLVLGAGLVLAGEAIRLWGVHHIGAVSRTRSDRLGPLIATGPFALVRNPLYLGNVAVWAGFALLSQLLWMVPIVIGLLGFEYHAIVRWEERLLESRLGEPYRAYVARVPRWWPKIPPPASRTIDSPSVRYSWRDTFFSERGTLIAIVCGSLALWIKSQL